MKRVFAHIGFSTALALIVLNLVSVKWALVILSVASVLFIASLIIDKTRNAVSIPLCLACVIFACLLFTSNYYGSYAKQMTLNGKSLNAEFYIVDIEKDNYSNYLYTVKTKSIDENNSPQNIKLCLRSNEKIDADYYEIICGNLKFESIADSGFDSSGKFADGIFLNAKLNDYEATGKTNNSFNKQILNLRIDIKKLFNRSLPKDSGALALALVTGDKSGLTDDIIDDFRQCGASHLMAVSGLHLSVVSFSLYWILKKLRVPKISRIVLSIAAICFYIALAGFSKSVIRAGIMMSVIYTGRLFKQKSDSLNSLGIAVFIICLNPYAVTDAGVLLTVTAALGTITLNKEISKRINTKNKVLNYFLNALSVSFSVFVATFPIMYFVFGTVSVVGIILNIVLIPIAEIALIASVVLALFQKIPLIVFFASEMCKYATETVIYIVNKFALLSYSLLKINSVEMGLAISSVFILFGISFIIKKNKTLKITALLSVFIITITCVTSLAVNRNNMFVREINGYKNKAYVIYDSDYAVIVGVCDNLQYRIAKGIVETSSLDILMIIDTESSDYSKKLTESAHVDNYVVNFNDIDKDAVNCDNILHIKDFNVDLLQYLNIEYAYYQHSKSCFISAKVYNSYFSLNTQIKDDFDVVYTVNSGGYKYWRINKWLK